MSKTKTCILINLKEPTLKRFCESFNLTNLEKELTRFNNPSHSSCIDFILIKKMSFQNLCGIETGLLDFFKMTVSGLKVQSCKFAPRVISYNDYKTFSNKNFTNTRRFKKTEEKFSYHVIIRIMLRF